MFRSKNKRIYKRNKLIKFIRKDASVQKLNKKPSNILFIYPAGTMFLIFKCKNSNYVLCIYSKLVFFYITINKDHIKLLKYFNDINAINIQFYTTFFLHKLAVSKLKQTFYHIITA